MNKYKHLTFEDRCTIAALKKEGFSYHAIADHIDVNVSTISREISRNSIKGRYHGEIAHKLSQVRKGPQYHKLIPEVERLIKKHLSLKWSPQQIVGWLQKYNLPFVSHERIYQYIWKDKQKGGELKKRYLRTNSSRNTKTSDICD